MLDKNVTKKLINDDVNTINQTTKPTYLHSKLYNICFPSQKTFLTKIVLQLIKNYFIEFFSFELFVFNNV